LKQIGIAMHNYHTANNTFAMAYATSTTTGEIRGSWGTWSPHALMLGYLEQAAVFNSSISMSSTRTTMPALH